MEGLVLHGAAHIFFENKLGELETHINNKFKKIEMKLKKEMKEIFKYQANEIDKIKFDIQEIKDELHDIRQSEVTITQKGMNKISKLSKEVKTELNEIKKLKTDVSGLKKEVIGIRQSEEDLSKMGMDKLSKMNDEFKTEVKQIRTEMKSVKKDIVAIKMAANKHTDGDNNERDEIFEPDKRIERKKRNSSYREATVPPPIAELFNSSEEEAEKTDEGKIKQEITICAGESSKCSSNNTEPDNDVGAQAQKIHENGVLQTLGGQDYEDNYLKNYNDDHIR